LNDQQLDDEVAELTDAVLENRMIQASEDGHDYEPVIHQLKAIIEPESGVPAAFREQLTQRLNDEWLMSRRARRAPQPRRFSSRPMRVATLAASVAVILLAAVLILNPSEPATTDVGGTVLNGSVVIVIAALVGGVIAFALLRRKR
jgi:hypothetical protein